ncbi:aldehyde dehydrogenase family protein, partial [Stutzerimonas nitrititolerans]|uniref:aldehyde dehydrogenase family protein n=1 Tax=Stutzerimonas nitrititolerans TaxID=2482751 RepID=UPI0028A5B65B
MNLQLGQPDLLRQTAYLNGEWREADSGARTEIFNPATGELIGAVPNMGRGETRRAIEAAQAAQPAWRALTAKERAARLRRWYELMLENQE